MAHIWYESCFLLLPYIHTIINSDNIAKKKKKS